MINTFFHLLNHDFKLLFRYNIMLISVIVSLIYVGVFHLLSVFGNTDKILVLVIYNDPALLGFLFIGVLYLFEKNENTLAVLSITPFKLNHYILSKTLSLSAVAVFCCYVMVFAAYGIHFGILIFGLASFLTSVLFSFFGFIVVAKQTVFNEYLLRAIGVLLFLCLPFLSYFELISSIWFIYHPTYLTLLLFDAAFNATSSSLELVFATLGTVLWLILGFFGAKRALKQDINRD